MMIQRSNVHALVLLTWCITFSNGFAPMHQSPITPLSSTQSKNTLTPLQKRTSPNNIVGYSNCDSQLEGIPKMFRWLTDQYPNIIRDRLEEGLSSDIEVDNFYLDMNGIIHPCTHGNAQELIYLDETAMFKKIFLYVDRLYKMVGPKEVMYLAVDGVAPRAKMNQQRSRRFRSAKEAEQMEAEIVARDQHNSKHSEDYRKKKKDGPDLSDKTKFDSNCITPGTDFMLKLSLAMQKWVAYKIETDPFWKNGAKVIVSGPDVPGEGEHKVMDFIRDSRNAYYKGNDAAKGLYKPGATHVLYGLDADLIMLGLVTHEPNFMLLREKMSVVMAGRGRNKYRKKKDMMEYTRHDFELLEIASLRQLLAIQFRKFSDKIEDYNLDRIVDDFVFMCMMVGNDFLPHSPHLEIDGGAISLMMASYIDLLPEWKGYLTDKEKIHPQRFEQFTYHLAVYEEEHFKKRGYEENEPGWKLPTEYEEDKNDFYGTYFSGNPTPKAVVAANAKGTEPPPSKIPETAEGETPDVDSDVKGPIGNRAYRNRHPKSKARSYRDFYYEDKMKWPVEDRDRTLFQRRAHAREYMEGLHWVLNYYHNGCMSWDWYFPHLYAPLSTDMVNLSEFYDEFEGSEEEGEYKSWPFDKGTPFPSLAQLLSVLPPQSASLLPKPLAELMLHPSSPLIPFYPPDFTSDANGKRQSWEAVVQIPFIESEILLNTMEQILEKDNDDGSTLLTPGERRRNTRGKHHLFVPKGDGENGAAKKAPANGARKQSSGGKPMAKGSSGGKRKPSTKGQKRVANTEG